MSNNFRKLTAYEHSLLQHLLSVDFPGKEDIEQMLPDLEAQKIDGEDSIKLRCLSSKKVSVVKRIPVEAEANDEDHVAIHVLLHVIDKVPTEVEIYKDDGSRVKNMPPVIDFQVIVLSAVTRPPYWKN